MDFLITESQLQLILLEQSDSKLTSNMKQLFSFTNNMVNKVIKNYGLNIKMLLTWGTAVGGLVMPLDNFIKEGGFNLSEKEITEREKKKEISLIQSKEKDSKDKK